MTLHEILVELQECQGAIDDSEYTQEDRAVLRDAAKERLVALRWYLLPKGKQRVEGDKGK